MTLSSLTILLAANSKIDDIEKAKMLLNQQAEILYFLNPKIKFIDSIKSLNDYSRFCIQDLRSCFDTDFVLIVQLDGRILNPSAFSFKFFEYDYIGAPWAEYIFLKKRLLKMNKDISNLNYRVGNGGFSLRSKKLCEMTKKYSNLWNGENEDTFISLTLRDKLEKEGIKFAPYEVAKNFSVERDVYNGQFGAHKWILSNDLQINVKELCI